jgi:hypothetical protein
VSAPGSSSCHPRNTATVSLGRPGGTGTPTGAGDDKKQDTRRGGGGGSGGGRQPAGQPATAAGGGPKLTCPPGRVPNRSGTACVIDLGGDSAFTPGSRPGTGGGPSGTPMTAPPTDRGGKF